MDAMSEIGFFCRVVALSFREGEGRGHPEGAQSRTPSC